MTLQFPLLAYIYCKDKSPVLSFHGINYHYSFFKKFDFFAHSEDYWVNWLKSCFALYQLYIELKTKSCPAMFCLKKIGQLNKIWQPFTIFKSAWDGSRIWHIDGVWGYVNTQVKWFGSDLRLWILCINALYDNFCVHVVLKPWPPRFLSTKKLCPPIC